MLIAAAVCPHPPLLVPELAGAAAPELAGLRAACRAAVAPLLDAPALVVVGGAERTERFPGTASGTFAPYGLDLRVGEGEPVLPLSLTVGRWLLDGLAPSAFQAVSFDAPARECLELGRALAARDVALLVMGDGSACRDEKAPGYLDERAAPYDREIARALGEADAAALGRLDPALARELTAAGRAAWQVLAGAAEGRRYKATLLADEAPYGVGYFAASWR
ncbi:class III extradiol dioxygenase subunit B-like domain-containing protein [Actinocorallia sp. API 0066]|uniref:class III extradiol dioxygenase subunit B-like domain-containing protein n=1 Tax=Actinocorallia sp. API 0066 TaxID=2896846 RepID=UPI001E2BDFE6|nr:class III extradiol dioxygenase subunit B-like domain-containing protein [Actinocorallia sp. API 0066]MCD0453575.1 class III extradiol dioxygenase subunit B-like domain-containing protein [Actinocorallia sp. API 0066]